MGGKLFKAKKDTRVLMVGLDGAGKTTILCKLKHGMVISTIPTVGFNVETVQFKKVRFCIWDVGGQDKIRGLWKHYYQNTQAVAFVVDSCDRDRIQEAKTELSKLLNEPELEKAFVLILANKQDLPNSLTAQEITDLLGLGAQRTTRHEVKVQPCCAVTGYGLEDGLSWMAGVLAQRRKRSKSRSKG